MMKLVLVLGITLSSSLGLTQTCQSVCTLSQYFKVRDHVRWHFVDVLLNGQRVHLISGQVILTPGEGGWGEDLSSPARVQEAKVYAQALAARGVCIDATDLK